jgi:hypothetical protein
MMFSQRGGKYVSSRRFPPLAAGAVAHTAEALVEKRSVAM